MGKATRESSFGRRMGKVPYWDCLFVTEKKDYSCLCTWTTSKTGWKETNLDPMWTVLMKDVDLGEPTPCLDHVYLGCTQRECKNKQWYCGQSQRFV